MKSGAIIACILILAALVRSDLNMDKNSRVKRVAHGTLVPKGGNQSPSVVSIRSRTPKAYVGDNHFCTGTIITEVFVITTARCVVDKTKVMLRPRQLLVTAGSPERLKLNTDSVNIPVKFLVVHQNYTLYNSFDIALLRLAEPIPDTNRLIDVTFPGFIEPPFGSKCTVMGWGRLYEGGPLSNHIMSSEVTLFEEKKCASLFNTFIDGMLCAAGDDINFSQGPCPGDTGGPLFCGEKLVGLVSYTTGCGEPTFPSIFTSTYYYANWIESTIDNGKSPLSEFKNMYLIKMSVSALLSLLIMNKYICYYRI